MSQRAAVPLFSFLSLLLLSAPALAQTCKCADQGDIKRRLHEVDTALKAYQTEIGKMTEQMQRTHDPLMYTKERREKLQGRVQDALNQSPAGGISPMPTMNDNPGGTSNLCEVTINLHPSATACMRESVTRHENLHRDQCLRTRSAGRIKDSVVSGKDRFERDNATLVQYAAEEISAYSVEKQFLQSELSRLQNAAECKPKPIEQRDYTSTPRRSNSGSSSRQSPVDSVRRRFGF